MKTRFALVALAVLISVGGSSAEAASRLCPEPWRGAVANDCELNSHTLPIWNNWSLRGEQGSITAQIRSGYLKENAKVPFRGNILYYQGLADSMVNHAPLFSKLTAAGFRVIAFDYMGQGGSSGSMNDTRVLQIPFLGNQIWKRYARDLRTYPKKTVIGWSTGALAAYAQAAAGQSVDQIVLLAPGIVPKLFVGEQRFLEGKLNLITLESLTSAKTFIGGVDPHLDPIRPSSPLEVFDGFAWDLLNTAKYVQSLPMRSTVRGFVLLSGKGDTYVDGPKTLKILKKRVPDFGSPRFSAKTYEKARHEIDNETPLIASEAHADILRFLTH